LEGKIGALTLGLLLVIVGLALLLFTAYTAYVAYKQEVVVVEAATLEQALSASTQVLLQLLVKVAFLAVVLAAGSIILARGVSLVRRPCGEEG